VDEGAKERGREGRRRLGRDSGMREEWRREGNGRGERMGKMERKEEEKQLPRT
jgi:hypothetical protein